MGVFVVDTSGKRSFYSDIFSINYRDQYIVLRSTHGVEATIFLADVVQISIVK